MKIKNETACPIDTKVLPDSFIKLTGDELGAECARHYGLPLHIKGVNGQELALHEFDVVHKSNEIPKLNATYIMTKIKVKNEKTN